MSFSKSALRCEYSRRFSMVVRCGFHNCQLFVISRAKRLQLCRSICTYPTPFTQAVPAMLSYITARKSAIRCFLCFSPDLNFFVTWCMAEHSASRRAAEFREKHNCQQLERWRKQGVAFALTQINLNRKPTFTLHLNTLAPSIETKAGRLFRSIFPTDFTKAKYYKHTWAWSL